MCQKDQEDKKTQSHKTNRHTSSGRNHNADCDKVISQIFCPSCRGSQKQLQWQGTGWRSLCCCSTPFPEPVDYQRFGKARKMLLGLPPGTCQDLMMSVRQKRGIRQKENRLLPFFWQQMTLKCKNKKQKIKKQIKIALTYKQHTLFCQ